MKLHFFFSCPLCHASFVVNGEVQLEVIFLAHVQPDGPPGPNPAQQLLAFYQEGELIVSNIPFM